MSYIETLTRFLIRAVQHPVSQSIMRHAIRVGTAELVRQVNRRTKAGVAGDLRIH